MVAGEIAKFRFFTTTKELQNMDCGCLTLNIKINVIALKHERSNIMGAS